MSGTREDDLHAGVHGLHLGRACVHFHYHRARQVQAQILKLGTKHLLPHSIRIKKKNIENIFVFETIKYNICFNNLNDREKFIHTNSIFFLSHEKSVRLKETLIMSYKGI